MFTLKSLSLKAPVFQSPMAGCTDLAFRLVARKRGMEYCFLEMISANGLMHESGHTHDLMKTIPEDRPLGAQLMGSEPDVMAAAAEKVESMGYDSLDLNLGCPARKITTQCSGSAMLKDPENAEKVFKAVVRAVKKIPVTVKMRKGYEDPSGDEAVLIAKIAEDCGLSMITVHGRTRVQGYTGVADWEAIGKVKRAVKIPVIGNGDVLTAADARRMRDVSGCDGIMIGRGGLGNPWIYGAIRSALYTNEDYHLPTLEEKKQTVLEHMELETKYEGPERAIFHMRRIGAWYIAGTPRASFWRGELNRCQTLADIARVIVQAFGDAELISDAPPSSVAFAS